MTEGMKVPNNVVFKYRVRTDGNPITYINYDNGDENPFEWKDVVSKELFEDKRVVLFSLPGAFTPTCSTYQLPDFENLYQEIRDEGVDEVYVISVNDTFVMRQWMIHHNIQNLEFIPDGNGEFTQRMGMLVCKDHLGFGNRSWRYAAVIDNGTVEKWFEEPGINNKGDDFDPYGNTSAEMVLDYLKWVNHGPNWDNVQDVAYAA
tara:strand:- start:3426 stop:4037 length:612 start_codon:yes stop_codon:yes gene_type:complete